MMSGKASLMLRLVGRLVFSTHEIRVLCSRPRSVSDVAHQEEVVRALQKAMESSNVRHMPLAEHCQMLPLLLSLSRCQRTDGLHAYLISFIPCSCRTCSSMGHLELGRHQQPWLWRGSYMGAHFSSAFFLM